MNAVPAGQIDKKTQGRVLSLLSQGVRDTLAHRFGGKSMKGLLPRWAATQERLNAAPLGHEEWEV